MSSPVLGNLFGIILLEGTGRESPQAFSFMLVLIHVVFLFFIIIIISVMMSSSNMFIFIFMIIFIFIIFIINFFAASCRSHLHINPNCILSSCPFSFKGLAHFLPQPIRLPAVYGVLLVWACTAQLLWLPETPELNDG